MWCYEKSGKNAYKSIIFLVFSAQHKILSKIRHCFNYLKFTQNYPLFIKNTFNLNKNSIMPIIYYCRFLTFCTGSGAQSKILKYDPQTTTQSIYTVKEIASAENCQLKIQTIKNKIENSSFLDKFLRFKNKQIIIQNKYDEFRSRLRCKSKKKSVQCFFFYFLY